VEENKKPVILNLGCGNDIRENCINIDITQPADLIHDLNQPLPFKNNSVDVILASHILEHIKELNSLKKEMVRVLKYMGSLEVIVPNFTSPDAYGDPDHKHIFSYHSFHTCYWDGMVLYSVNKMYPSLPKGYQTLFNGEEQTVWLIAKLIKLTPDQYNKEFYNTKKGVKDLEINL